MSKIVVRSVEPDLPQGSFGREPKTYYRVGSHYVRLEEEPDVPGGIHGLIVSNQRDHWIINLFSKVGRHAVDKGETYNSYIPIIPIKPDHEHADVLKHFQIGNEVAFMKKHQAKVTETDSGSLYSLELHGYAIELKTDKETGNPRQTTVKQGSEIEVDCIYDEYRTDLPKDMKLFQPPKGIKIIPVEKEAESRSNET